MHGPTAQGVCHHGQNRAARPGISSSAFRDQRTLPAAAPSRRSTGPTACQTPVLPSQVQHSPAARQHVPGMATEHAACAALQKGWGWLQSTATGVKQHDWDRDKKVVAQSASRRWQQAKDVTQDKYKQLVGGSLMVRVFAWHLSMHLDEHATHPPPAFCCRRTARRKPHSSHAPGQCWCAAWPSRAGACRRPTSLQTSAQTSRMRCTCSWAHCMQVRLLSAGYCACSERRRTISQDPSCSFCKESSQIG